MDEKEVERQRVGGDPSTEERQQRIEDQAEQRRPTEENRRRRAEASASAATQARNQKQITNLKRQIDSQKNIISKADETIAKGGNRVAGAKKKKSRAEDKIKDFETKLADIGVTTEATPVLPPVPSDNPRENQLVRDLERTLSADNLQSRYRAVNAFILKQESYLSRRIGPAIDDLEERIAKDTAVVESGKANDPKVRRAMGSIEKNKETASEDFG